MDHGSIIDFVTLLLELDQAEARFLARKILDIMEKNKFHLIRDHDNEFTSLGSVVAALFEMVLVFGVMKLNPVKPERGSDGRKEE